MRCDTYTILQVWVNNPCLVPWCHSLNYIKYLAAKEKKIIGWPASTACVCWTACCCGRAACYHKWCISGYWCCVAGLLMALPTCCCCCCITSLTCLLPSTLFDMSPTAKDHEILRDGCNNFRRYVAELFLFLGRSRWSGHTCILRRGRRTMW